MPHLSFIVSPDGFTLPVVVGLNGQASAACVASGQSVSPPLLAAALIDTGSDITCVAGRIMRQLGLKSVLQRKTQTIGGLVAVNLGCTET